MDYTNAILKVKSVNYIVASNITEENWNDVKSSLYYLNNNEYVAVDSSAVYDSTIDYYIKSNWLQLPAIKGTSAHIAASPTQTEIDSKTINGQVITITNEDPLVSDSQFIIWNGTPGDGQVNAVDGVSPAQGTHNLVLQAVRYSDNWSITAAEKSQARENIDALSAGLKINNVSVSGLFTDNETITLAASDIGAAPVIITSLKVNDKSINNLNTQPSITLTASDIGAAQAVLENLKINDKSIVNLSTTPSIILTSGDLGISYDTLLNEASGNAVQNSTLYNKFNEISTSITGIANRVTSIEGKTNQNYNRIVSVTLASGSWASASGYYTQEITLTDTTNNTKADINPDITVMNQMMNDSVTGMYVANDNSIFTVYAIGNAPTANITVQLVLNETT